MFYAWTFLPGTSLPVYVHTEDPNVRVYSYTRDLRDATPLTQPQADGWVESLRDFGREGFCLPA
jgi:hypothetical protein